jgi:hypothetical protein
LPFTVDQFFGVFSAHNAAAWPARIVAYVVAGSALLLLLSGHRHRGRIAAAVLALFWLWNGLVYHSLFFAPINRAAYLFAAMFVAQGLTFLAYGAFGKGLGTYGHIPGSLITILTITGVTVIAITTTMATAITSTVASTLILSATVITMNAAITTTITAIAMATAMVTAAIITATATTNVVAATAEAPPTQMPGRLARAFENSAHLC